MLNLTENDITLIAESGETTTIPASGYVARVETTRREATKEGFTVPWDSGSSGLTRAAFRRVYISVIEETPTKIVFDGPHELGIENGDYCLLLVSREVAEAAHVLRHPLAERMVWANDPRPEFSSNGDALFKTTICRSLRRVPRGEA